LKAISRMTQIKIFGGTSSSKGIGETSGEDEREPNVNRMEREVEGVLEK